jgi:hypothetical protein
MLASPPTDRSPAAHMVQLHVIPPHPPLLSLAYQMNEIKPQELENYAEFSNIKMGWHREISSLAART